MLLAIQILSASIFLVVYRFRPQILIKWHNWLVRKLESKGIALDATPTVLKNIARSPQLRSELCMATASCPSAAPSVHHDINPAHIDSFNEFPYTAARLTEISELTNAAITFTNRPFEKLPPRSELCTGSVHKVLLNLLQSEPAGSPEDLTSQSSADNPKQVHLWRWAILEIEVARTNRLPKWYRPVNTFMIWLENKSARFREATQPKPVTS